MYRHSRFDNYWEEMMEDVYGECNCGAVSYKFSAVNLIAYQCHCSVCRKSTGSAFSTTLMAAEKGFQWIRGGEAVSSYVKENGYKHHFCSRCGSPVPNKFRDFPLFSIPVGSIENAPLVKVVAQLYTASSACWDKNTLVGHQFDEMPSLNEMLKLLEIDEGI